MATIHHNDGDEDIILDDDIIHDDPNFHKSVSTLSFEHIEAKHSNGNDFGRSPSNLGPTVEEDVDIEQEPIEAFPSSMSFSKTKQPQQQTTSIEQQQSTLLTIEQGEPNVEEYDDDLDEMPSLGTKRKETIIGATSTVQMTSTKQDITPLATNIEEDDKKDNNTQQNGATKSSDPRGKPPPVRTNNITTPPSTTKQLSIDIENTEQKKSQPGETPTPKSTVRTSNDGIKPIQPNQIELTQLDKTHHLPTPNEQKVKDMDELERLRAYHRYEYPTRELIDVTHQYKVDYNTLPSLSNVRILRHNELQQLYLYNSDEYEPGIPEEKITGEKIDINKPRSFDQKLAKCCCGLTIFNPEHGKYKWVVLILSWFSLLMVSLIMSSSIYSDMFQKQFNISRSMVSWFPSIQIGLFCISNLLASFVCDIIGGYFTLALSFLITIWAFFIPALLMNYIAILICHAVLVGLGAGFMQISTLYVLADYFALVPGDYVAENDKDGKDDQNNGKNVDVKTDENDKDIEAGKDNITQDGDNNNTTTTKSTDTKKVEQDDNYKKTKLSTPFAVGFALSAFGIGNIMWSPFLDYFINKYQHFKEALLLSGCFFFFIGTIILILLRQRTYSVNATKSILLGFLQYEMERLISLLPTETGTLLKAQKPDWDSLLHGLVYHSYASKVVDFRLFNESSFVLLFLVCLFGSFMFHAPFVHLIPHSIDNGLTGAESSSLIMIIGGVTFVFRVIFSLFVTYVHPVYCLVLACALHLLCAIIWFLSTTRGMFQFTAVLTGLSSAAFIVAISGLPSRIFSSGKHTLPALSMMYGLAFAPAAIISGPVMGWVRDEYGVYDRFLIALIIIAALTLIISSLIIATLRVKEKNDEMKSWAEEKLNGERQNEDDAARKAEVAKLLILQCMNNNEPQLDAISEDGNDDNNKDENKNDDKKGTSNNTQKITPKQLSQHIELLLRVRPVIIKPQQQTYMWYIHPNRIGAMAAQYTIAFALWSLSKNPNSGWRKLYF